MRYEVRCSGTISKFAICMCRRVHSKHGNTLKVDLRILRAMSQVSFYPLFVEQYGSAQRGTRRYPRPCFTAQHRSCSRSLVMQRSIIRYLALTKIDQMAAHTTLHPKLPMPPCNRRPFDPVMGEKCFLRCLPCFCRSITA